MNMQEENHPPKPEPVEGTSSTEGTETQGATISTKATLESDGTPSQKQKPTPQMSDGGLGAWVKKLFHKGNLTGLLVLILLVALFLVFSRTPLRIDLTSSKINTLSSVSKSIVSDLRDPIRIKVFISPNLPPPLNAVEQSLQDILFEYRQAAGGNFEYTFYRVDEKQADVSPSMQETLDLARNYGIYPRSLQAIDKDEVKLVNAYSGMVIEYGNIIERIEFVTESEPLEYSLSAILKKVTDRVNTLLAIDNDAIRVTLYLSDIFVELAPYFGIDALATVPAELEEAVETLSLENYSKLAFTHENRSVTPDLRARIDGLAANVYPWEDFSIDGTNYDAGVGSAFVLVEYEDKSEVIELLSREEVIQITENGLESVLRYNAIPTEGVSERINSVVNRILEITPPLAYLSGKGTLDLAQGNFETTGQNAQRIAEGANFAATLQTRYELSGVSLEELSAQVYPTLIIAGPKEPFSEYELFLIDQYVMSGGSLMLFLDSYVAVGGDQFPGGLGNNIPTWAPNTTGLEKLIEHYGVRLDSSVVMDKVSFVSRGQGANGVANQQNVFYAALIENNKVNTNLPYMKNVKGVFFIAGAPLFPVESALAASGVTATRLLSSSDQSWNVSEDVTLIPYLIQPPAGSPEDYTSFDLAYMLEGSFTSYFSGKELPTREENILSEASGDSASGNANAAGRGAAVQSLAEEGAATRFIEQAPPSGQIAVMSSSEVIKNNVTDSAGQFPNSILALNVVDALNNEAEWAVMRSKGLRVNPLDIQVGEGGAPLVWYKRPTVIKAVNLVGWPLGVIILGLLMVLQKVRRRQRVAAHFAGLSKHPQGELPPPAAPGSSESNSSTAAASAS